MISTCVHDGELPGPIPSLERYFREGGVSLIRAVFENTFFASPESVRSRTPYFPAFARKSLTHYPGLGKGADAVWLGEPVRLDDNSRAQLAWAKYSGRPIHRGSGYGVRHVWGNPWNPLAFTAGWNMAYMPFWAGMLTEDQHPHPGVQSAIKQASWELYFRSDPVCEAPDFVQDPGVDLASVLDGTPLLILEPSSATSGASAREAAVQAVAGDAAAVVRVIRSQSNASWSNLKKAVRALQDLEHEPFGTPNVEASSKSHVRRMLRETGLDLPALTVLLDELG